MTQQNDRGAYVATHIPGQRKEYKNPVSYGKNAFKADETGEGNETTIDQTSAYQSTDEMGYGNELTIQQKATFNTMDNTGTEWMVTDNQYAPPFEPSEDMADDSYIQEVKSVRQKRLEWAYNQGYQSAVRSLTNAPHLQMQSKSQPRRKTYTNPYDALSKIYVNAKSGGLSKPENQDIAEGLLVLLEQLPIYEADDMQELIDMLDCLADGNFLDVDPWHLVELIAAAQGEYTPQLRLMPPMDQY